jgi:translation initiation factor 2B subunit (eIF-2B alpha/beta/delta family)
MIDETVAEIREMQSHSSSAVAVKAATALRELLDREYTSLQAFDRDLEHNAGALRRANPSHASLHNAMRRITNAVIGEAETPEAAKEMLDDAITETVEHIESGKRRAAAHAAELIDDRETLLLHDYSSTVLEALETTCSNGTHLHAYVTEARPRYLGRKAARTLAGIDRVEPHLIVDSAAGHFLPECDRVLIGMDCIVEGTLYNRIGTYQIAAAAAREGVPVTVVGSSAKVIDEFRFENEFRPASEVMREPVAGVDIENPAYDATPVELIDTLVTDVGVREL